MYFYLIAVHELALTILIIMFVCGLCSTSIEFSNH